MYIKVNIKELKNQLMLKEPITYAYPGHTVFATHLLVAASEDKLLS